MSERRLRSFFIGLVLIVSASIWLLSQPKTEPSKPKGTTTNQPSIPSDFTQDQADEIAAKVMSGDVTLLKRSVVMPADIDISEEALVGLQSLKVFIDASTFNNDIDAPSVQASVTNPEGGHEDRTVFLVKNEGRWMITQDILNI